MAKIVKYKQEHISHNSKAYELWEKKEFKLLDKHLKQLDKDNELLIKHYQEKVK